MTVARLTELTDAPDPLPAGTYLLVDNEAWEGAMRVAAEQVGGMGVMGARSVLGDPTISTPDAEPMALEALRIRLERIERQLGLIGEV